MISADIAIEADGWPPEAKLHETALQAFQTTAELAELDDSFSVSLLFTDDVAMRELNRQWRGQDKPTNVLSFPAPDMPQRPDGDAPFYGDIALALETLEREAEADAKLFDHHLTHLLVHGLLHLAGYDHETDAEAEEMEALETRILARLAIADPYALQEQDRP
jgi:probable rRNA maturation factor